MNEMNIPMEPILSPVSGEDVLRPLQMGKRIQTLRKQQEMTQEQLADLLGVTAAAVSKWETNLSYPDITLLCPLARSLHISVDILLGFQEKMTKEECLEALKELEKLFSSHKAEEAVRYCRELLKQYPTDAYLKLRIAGLYVQYLTAMKNGKDSGYSAKFADEQVRQAVELLEYSALSEEKEIAETSWYMLSSLYLMQGEEEKALAALEHLPQPGYDARIMKAGILLQTGKIEEAEKLNQTCLYEAINNSGLYLLNLFTIAEKKGEEQRALDMLEKGLELYEVFQCSKIGIMDTNYHLGKAVIYCRGGKQEEALLELSAVAKGYLRMFAKDIVKLPEYFDKLTIQENYSSRREFLLENAIMLLEQEEGLESLRTREEYKKILADLQEACADL
ncbi:helix-turn-helix domain-containing protein [Mediterraneibacter massiliensis]|uniref:helix-turn-helix domain-containing protein n=1 Tax=Mediterraneibacter massiliensis TaxID=1720300 RepID=UPI000E4DD270|nr:helix-turn-helix domain-containing protein [Mediterraneibacter massiliensis]RGT74937.1 helix-turn-helix domain-containing protein [Ruminococcus sp. AF18-22]